MSEEIPKEEMKLNEHLNLKNEFIPPTFEEWKALVEMDLKGASYEKKLITKTYEQIDLKPIYTKDDLKDLKHLDAQPGFNNFVRGSKVEGYFNESWAVNQEINLADAEEFNTALLEALNNGQNCINISLDSATKLGLDADYASAEQVGDSGLSISGIKSLERALKNIDLKNHPIFVNSGANNLPFLALVTSFCKLKNIDIKELHGSILADPISQLVQSGELQTTEEFIFTSIKQSIEWAENNSSKLKLIGINLTPFTNAGANSVQELAIAGSILVYYLDQLLALGLSAEKIIESTHFTFGVSTNYFMEIAKFRAAKVVLSNIANAYGLKENNINFSIGAKSFNFLSN